MTQPSGAAAVANARRTIHNQVGMCLWQVQEWWGSGHAWPDAISQWNHTVQHRDRAIPLGAPVFYSSSTHGHIAIYVGNGMIRSTDAPFNGATSEVPLDWPAARWAHPYIGWGSVLASARLPLGGTTPPPPPPPPPGSVVYLSKLRMGQSASDSVAALQRRLNATRFPPFTNVPVTGNYGPLTDAAVRAWQHFIGDAADPAGHSSIGPRQAARLWAGTGVTIRP